MRIDTLTKFDELVGSGVPEAQARVLAHSFATASEVDTTELATKADLKHLEKIMYVYAALITPCLGYLMFIK